MTQEEIQRLEEASGIFILECISLPEDLYQDTKRQMLENCAPSAWAYGYAMELFKVIEKHR